MARSHMGKDKVRGFQHTGAADAKISESDLGNEKQGNNRLQGNDQRNVRNQRNTMPEKLADRPKGPVQPHDIPNPKDRRADD